MKNLKTPGLAAVAAMALMAIGASGASATTFETNGALNLKDVVIEASAEGSIKLEKTDGTFVNTCIESNLAANDNTKTTGAAVEGPVVALGFANCANAPVVVDENGTLSIENIAGTTNGTVKSANAKVTVASPFGPLTCVTGGGTDIGTFTGKAAGLATIDIKAVLNCGFLAPSVIWRGAYTVTGGPNGIE